MNERVYRKYGFRWPPENWKIEVAIIILLVMLLLI